MRFFLLIFFESLARGSAVACFEVRDWSMASADFFRLAEPDNETSPVSLLLIPAF